jgi:uncharacterized protein (TIGR02118 family)
MVSVLVVYVGNPGTRFDLAYYTLRHLPLVRRLLEPMGMRSLTFVNDSTPDSTGASQAFRLVAELRFDDREATTRALGAHGAETQADIPNFTDVAPIVLIGELTSA